MLGKWPRRLLALGCLLLAAWSATHSIHSHGDAAAPTVPVIIAAHDLAAGALVTAADLRPSRWPAAVAPVDAIQITSAAIGRRLAAPIGIGELLTPQRLVTNDSPPVCPPAWSPYPYRSLIPVPPA